MRRNGAGPESISSSIPVAPWIPGSMLSHRPGMTYLAAEPHDRNPKFTLAERGEGRYTRK
jgi:hypothetical protein